MARFGKSSKLEFPHTQSTIYGSVFPWLDWELHEYIGAENYYNEVAEHVLEIKLSEVGRSILALEDFYNSDLPPFHPDDHDFVLWSDQDSHDEM